MNVGWKGIMHASQICGTNTTVLYTISEKLLLKTQCHVPLLVVAEVHTSHLQGGCTQFQPSVVIL